MARLTAKRWRRGTTIVEAAIVMTLLMGLIYGLMEYGWLFMNEQQLNSAAREGARLAALPDTTAAQLSDRISKIMSAGKMTSYTTTVTPGWDTAPKGTSITVTITVDYSTIRLTAGNLTPLPSTIHAAVSMNKEGP